MMIMKNKNDRIYCNYYICNLDDSEEEFSSQTDNTYHGKPQEIEVNESEWRVRVRLCR
jgi:hypothetical protein